MSMKEEWLAGAEAVRGGSHVRGNLLCQDVSAVYTEDEAILAVAADGHGSEEHFRSRIGAQLACRAAAEILLNTEFDQLTDQKIGCLCSEIIARWSCLVHESAAENPFSADEQTLFDVYAGQDRSIERAYGTTLSAALIRNNMFLALRCGDGECIVFDDDAAVSNPVPVHEACSGRYTTSLCDMNAESFRWHISSLIPAAVILTSDGLLNNAVDEEGLRRWTERKLLYGALNGVESIALSIHDDLIAASGMGAGDDVSAAFAVRKPSLYRMKERLAARFADQKSEEERLRQKKKIAAVKANIQWAEMAIERKQKEYEQLESIASENEENGGGLSVLSDEIERAREMLRENEAELTRLLRE